MSNLIPVEQKLVNFNGAEIMAIKCNDGKIFAGIRWVCNGLGLSKGQMQAERKRIQEDIVLSKGERKIVLPTTGGNKEVLCLELDFLPLWLAKINANIIDNPEVQERLVDYQLNAKDVLAEAFLGNKKASRVNDRLVELKLQELESKNKNAQARLMNAQVRQSRFILEEADKRKSNLSPESYELLQINGFEAVVGKNVLPRPKLATELYDLGTMAEILGINSGSKLPHAQAVGAIVSKLDINESERLITAYDRNGHQGSTYQYTQSVLDKAREWLLTNGNPAEIVYTDKVGKTKTYKVTYGDGLAR